MRSSYNVIKNNCVSSNSIYTIKAPVIPIREDIEELNGNGKQEMNLEEIKAYAKGLVNEANLKRDKILSSALEEAERIKKDAYDIAFRKGFSEGHLEGLKKGKEEGLKSFEGLKAEAKEVLEEAHRISREYISSQRGEILNLAMFIAEKIIGYQADVNDSVIYNTANDAIGAAVIKEQLVIRVNPMDYALLDCRRDELLKSAGENVIVSIIKDGSISRGGCRMESEVSTVDATLESQLEKIREALIGQ